MNGRAPVIVGVLTRHGGDFEEILEGSELIVELIGGIEPARELRARGDARRPPRRHRQQAAALAPRRGAVRGRARTRRAAPLRGGGRRRRAGRARARGVARRHADRAHPRDRQRHDQLHPLGDGARQHLRAGARRGAAPRLRRGRPERRRLRPRRGREDGDPRATRVRRACAPRRRPLRGDRAAAATTSRTRASWGWR